MSKDKLTVMMKERLKGHSDVFIAGVVKGYKLAIQDIQDSQKHEKT